MYLSHIHVNNNNHKTFAFDKYYYDTCFMMIEYSKLIALSMLHVKIIENITN